MKFFYSRNGKAKVIQKDHQLHNIKNGKLIGIVHENGVFNIHSKHLGFYDNGWIRDKNGCAVMFTDNCSDLGPKPPIHENTVHIPNLDNTTVPSTPSKIPNQPLSSKGWSILDVESFFEG